MKKLLYVMIVVLLGAVGYMTYDVITDMVAYAPEQAETPAADESKPAGADGNSVVVPTGQLQAESTTQQESTSKAERKTCTLVSVGDVLGHESVIYANQNADGSYDYDKLFAHLKSDFTEADLAVVNQETIFGGTDIYPYAGYPNFNSPEAIGDAEVRAGFDVILHATNHTRDTGEQGIEYCLNYWKTNHPDTTVLGIHASKKEQDTITVVTKNDIRIAMLNYTYGLNGYSLAAGKEYLVDLIDTERIRSDIRKAKEMADFVIVFPHWGIEYQYEPNTEQKNLAQMMADEGADLIIGTHPHVLESVEWLKGSSGNKTLCYYSLGNYISGQTATDRLLGGMARVTLVKEGDKTSIEDACLVPLVTHYVWSSNYYTSETYKLADYTKDLAAVHSIHSYDSGFSVSALKKLAEQIVGEKWISEK